MRSALTIIFIFTVLHLNFLQYAFSQQQITHTPLEFQQITDGLSQNHITDIYQDHEGYIWIATFNGGINRYNGLDFEIYTHDPLDSTSIPSNSVTKIFEDSDQELWIATYEGLAHFNRDKNNFDVLRNTKEDRSILSNNLILDIKEDNQKKFWIVTSTGVTKFDIKSGKSEIFGTEDSDVKFSHQNITNLSIDKKGRIWLGTDDGINIFYPEQKKVVIPEQTNGTDIGEGVIWEIYFDSKNNIWMGKQDGLYLLKEIDEHVFEVEHFFHDNADTKSLGAGKVAKIEEDKKGNLWIATENSGLNLFNPTEKNFYHYTHDPTNPTSIKSNSIWEIFEDREGRLWLGTFNQGINVYDPYHRKFFHKRRDTNQLDGLKHNAVSSFLQVDKNKFWIGTDGGGITEWDKEKDTYRYFEKSAGGPSSLSSNAVLAMHQSKDSSIWVATWEGGLNRYDPENATFEHYLYSQGSGDNVMSIEEDREGNIWVGVFYAGIKKLDKETGEFLLISCNELNSCFVRGINIDSKGDIWVVLENDGINRIQINKDDSYVITSFLHDSEVPKSLSSNTVRFVHQDSKGRIWIGTALGLNLYLSDEDGFKHFNKKDGLPNDMINGMVEDRQGNFWLSTNKGISRMTEIREEVFRFRNYDKSDGLQGNEFFREACYIDDQGWIYMGGTNGFNYFDPNEVKDNPNIPQVHFTNFKLFNKEVEVGVKGSPLSKDISLTDELTLTHKQSVFTLGFTSLNLTHSNKNQYAYMLEGFEDEWNYVIDQTSATYTNLNAGKYLFRVKASNNDAIWNEDGASIKITILPPWWETWWAQLIFYSSILLLGLGIFRTRVAIIEKQKRLLEKEVKLRTKEINKQKQEIEEQARSLKAINQQKNRLFSIISHDLRSPLSSLLGITSLLDTNLLKEEDLLRAKEEISSRIKGIGATMENLLFWAKEQMEGETINKERFDIYHVFEEVVALYVERADIKSITLVNQVAQNTFVFADRDQASVIIRNLVGNALKFTPERGSVIIGNKEHEDNRTIFYIKDNGLGINKDKIEALFELSSNKSTLGTAGEKGVGLGLILIKEYLEKNGGSISVESEINKGSTFFFDFPNKTEG